MLKYETMFILRPELENEAYDTLVEKFKGIIEAQKGEVTNVNRMGRRKLAYEVMKKFREGYYVLFNYSAEAGVTAELERNFKISDDVIRYLIVKEGE
ncbi:MAG: 30S ribosomal protein S6 [Dethiobacter sp.]|jgi:small subunit ribosomal protein S6|nr:30S ribosomal protein S6 [Dethiobacter sp.]MBS3897350.1 30S ribosomal protein S6 [Dethiobacter sp.]MBS3983853.1 30S ribosomal protein S6 [Dethiobacter sp.]MCL4463613.1 30S ribosomal protein S6 [Bacillota bacterium]MCL5992897.1 30S ribosomal protein S6 [Bacillota bacterium]